MITNLDYLAISFIIAMISLVTIIITISFDIIRNKKQSYKLNTKNIEEG
jgi:hypothetical protein